MFKPIFIVGTGRCGSTVFHRVLASHPQMMWLSGTALLYPDRPVWNRWAVNIVANPMLRSILGGKIRPGEQYRFWDHYAYGFSEPGRDLVRSDVTPRVKRQVRAAFQTMLTRKRNRLLLKITGWPRLGYLDEIFGDAKFIHIVRDGRAVASSLLHIHFWRGWHGPHAWLSGPLSPEDEATWESHDRSFAALAGLEWRIQIRAMEAAQRAIDSKRFFEIKYETFCDHPLETYRRVLDFAELPQSDEFDRQVRKASIKSTSNRWRDDLTVEQQDILNDVLRDDLLRYGYSVPPHSDHRYQTHTVGEPAGS